MKNIQVACPPLAGKSTFAFDYAKRRAISSMHDPNQIGKILALTKYPSVSGQLESLDVTVRAKLIAHLEDVFEENRFSNDHAIQTIVKTQDGLVRTTD
jgi:hypothetical protein